jgi:SNF2 family DNA or RNA helicase
MSLKCGALGLNLTTASRVILADCWWNPSVEGTPTLEMVLDRITYKGTIDQAVNRVHRIGQTRPVELIKMVTRDTVEERIVDLQNEKVYIYFETLF